LQIDLSFFNENSVKNKIDDKKKPKLKLTQCLYLALIFIKKLDDVALLKATIIKGNHYQ
jgi:hypothetical protein